MNVFDIIGPVMIGPSSSHTAGAVRLGRIAAKLLGEKPVRAEIELCGSFARTYRGHGTDKALAAGIQGMGPDDGRIRNSLELAAASGLDISFRPASIPGAHPNTARIALTGAEGGRVVLRGASVGGGSILVDQINGMDVAVTGQHDTLLVFHRDEPGTIAAVADLVARSGINIGNFRLSRPERGGAAVMTIEADGEIPEELCGRVDGLPHVEKAVMLRAV